VRLVNLMREDQPGDMLPDWLRQSLESGAVPYQVLNKLYYQGAGGGVTTASGLHAGDYTGARLGVGLELRWYWRAGHRAWLSRLAPNNLAGWFVGAEALVATDLVHDNADHRWLGTSLQLGGAAHVGYRIAPWRELTITPSVGVELGHDLDLAGRVPGYTTCYPTIGLDVGWLF